MKMESDLKELVVWTTWVLGRGFPVCVHLPAPFPPFLPRLITWDLGLPQVWVVLPDGRDMPNPPVGEDSLFGTSIWMGPPTFPRPSSPHECPGVFPGPWDWPGDGSWRNCGSGECCLCGSLLILFYFILVEKLNMSPTLLTIFSVYNTVLLTVVRCCIADL